MSIKTYYRRSFTNLPTHLNILNLTGSPVAVCVTRRVEGRRAEAQVCNVLKQKRTTDKQAMAAGEEMEASEVEAQASGV